MAIVINGSGTVTGLSVGGLPDGSVDSDTLASGIDKTSISDSGDATAMTIDSGERIGIGNTVAGTMNGVNSSILTIGTGSGHSGMTVYTGSTNEGTINFADDTSGSGTYKGMVRYDHNTNALTLHSNATESIKIDSSGAVTMPSQPVASFGWSGDISANNVIPANLIRVNIGSHLNSSGRFTAPIAGTYWYGYVGMSHNATNNFKVELLKNGSLNGNDTRAYTHDVAYSQNSIFGFITLSANDYLEFKPQNVTLHSNYGQISIKLVA